MVGRAVYEHPLRWTQIDEIFFGEPQKDISASIILKNLLPYAELHLLKGGRLWDICKHTLNLVQAVPGARKWRNNLSQKAQKSKAGLNIKKLVNNSKARRDSMV